MKKLLLLFVLFFSSILININAQESKKNEEIVVSRSDLPSSVLKDLERKNELKDLEFKIEKYGKWAGMGDEIGNAVNGALTAVKDVSIDFADSDLGKFTMLMVAWKIMGVDILKIFIGILIIVIGWYFTLRSYFKLCMPTKIYLNGKQPLLFRFFKSSGEYKIQSPIYNDGAGFVHFIIIAAFVGLGTLIMFL